MPTIRLSDLPQTIYAPYIPFYQTATSYVNVRVDQDLPTKKETNTMPCDCPSCKRDDILNGTLKANCANCNSELDALSKFQIMGDKTLVCEKCVTELYVSCPCCQKLHKKADMKKAKFRDNADTLICQKCFSQHYRECNCCGNYFDRHDVMGHGDKTFCRPCFDKSFQICSHCNSIQPKGSMTHYRTLYAQRSDPPTLVCNSCWSVYGPINRYESKPKMVFNGRPPHYYGIELECELENHKKEERGAKAQEVVDLLGEFVVVKEDGSLNTGFEICTQPASLDEHRIRWGKLFDNLPSNLISFNSKNCGLHIHCSKKPLSLLTIAKIVVFMNDEKNQQFVETIAGRTACSYATLAKKKHSHVMRINSSRSREYRYEAVNLINDDTIEFRIFKGTLKRESLYKAIEFCDALIHFCMMGNNSITFCKDVKNFMDYVGLRAKDYPHLYAFMCAKVLKQETKLSKQFGFSVPAPRQKPEPTVKPTAPPMPTPVTPVEATTGIVESVPQPTPATPAPPRPVALDNEDNQV